MPFSIEIPGGNPENRIHIIIDRKNVIFTATHDGDIRSRQKANVIRDKIREVISQNNSINGYLSEDKNFSGTEDPRHGALVHVGYYDRIRCYHSHHIFKKMVDYRIFKLLLVNCDFSQISHLIPPSSIPSILEAASHYFIELASEKGHIIEQAYQEDKDHEYQLACKKVDAAEKTFTRSAAAIEVTHNSHFQHANNIQQLSLISPSIYQPSFFFPTRDDRFEPNVSSTYAEELANNSSSSFRARSNSL